MKKVMVLGATPNKRRFAHTCVKSLIRYGYEVVPVGIKEGEINGKKIIPGKPQVRDIHTVTIYLNDRNQKEYYDYLLSQNPRRIIFNPGAENPHLKELARKKDIEVVEDCTLVMLNSGSF
ncbi:MAG: CoA-binding protein [Bacteroidales bacterium]